MKIDNVRRIRAEDFAKEEQALIEKLSTILNSHMDQVVEALTNSLNFDNLHQEIVILTTVVDANGQVVNSVDAGSAISSNPQFSSNVVARPIGACIIRADNLTNPSSYTAGSPFIHFSTVSDNLFKINKIEGLIDRNKYSLKILLFGN